MADVRGEIIIGEYATTLVVGPPDRPEPVRKQDRKLTRKDLRTKFGATAEELDEIIAMEGFPAAGKHAPFGAWTIELRWSENLVDAWRAKRRAEAARTLELIG
jgi:hypothetical protein